MGVVLGPHGVQGDVRIKSFTQAAEDIGAYGPVEDATGARQFTLSVRGASRGTVIARIAGVADRGAAEALHGLKLYLPRARLDPLNDDEFYHADLIGLSATLPSGALLGRVIAVHDFGAGPMLEIAIAGRDSILVPFNRIEVPRVDLEAGCVIVEPAAELPATELEAEDAA